MIRIRFVKDYYGEKSGILLLREGDEGDFREDVAKRLIKEGYAVKA